MRQRELATPQQRVEAEIRQRLDRMGPGEGLPPVRKLAEEYGVGTTTVWRVIARLKAAGVVTGRPGWGIFKT